MNLTSILSATIEAGKRILKFASRGKNDVQTAGEAMPFGLDSVPVKNIAALLLRTTEDGKTYIAGYINKNQKAEAGEFRTFATDADGAEVFYTWMKKDGTMEIGGNQNFAVRFNELKEEFNKLKKSHNDLLGEYKTHTHTVPGVTAGSGSTTSSTTVSTQVDNDSNIDHAKNDKIKTI